LTSQGKYGRICATSKNSKNQKRGYEFCFLLLGDKRVMKTGETAFSEQEFITRIRNTEQFRLIEMMNALEKSSQELTGRAKRLAKRQYAIVKAELDRRADKLKKNIATDNNEHSENNSNEVENSEIFNQASVKERKVPPQFNTPQAIAKRREAIREYHRRRKAQIMKQRMETENYDSARWFNTLLDTLRQDANRHELAAKNYAKAPELFTLHIEHSARAFELNRILDMLIMYSQILQKQADTK